MPVSFVYAERGTVVVLVASGRTTGSDFIRASNEVLAQCDRAKNVRYALIDLCEISDFDVSAAEVRHVAELGRNSSKIDPRTIAVSIAVSKRAVLGMVRMWELLVNWDTWKVHVCDTLTEAEKWLRSQMARAPDGHCDHGGTASRC
jgi:hypothetical protein